MRRWLPATWVGMSILWLVGALRAQGAIARQGGPGSGGAVLAMPWVVVMVALALAGLAIAALLHSRFARATALVAGGAGLLGTLASLPAVLSTMIYLGIMLDGGGWAEAIAAGLAPFLFLVTLLDGLRPPPPRPRRAVFIAVPVALSLIALDAVPVHDRDGMLDEAAQVPLRVELERALVAEDEAALADPRAFRVSFPLPEEDGSESTGDIVERAIWLKKPKAVHALLARRQPNRDGYLRRALDVGDRRVLDEVFRIGGFSSEVWDEALRSRHVEAIEFAIAHGQSPDALVCRLRTLLGLDEADRQRKLEALRQRGAQAEPSCPAAAR